jgi:hypothetical protein
LLDHWALPASDNIPSYSKCFINQGKSMVRNEVIGRSDQLILGSDVYAHARNAAPLAYHRSGHRWELTVIPVRKSTSSRDKTSNATPACVLPRVLTCLVAFVMSRGGDYLWVWTLEHNRHETGFLFLGDQPDIFYSLKVRRMQGGFISWSNTIGLFEWPFERVETTLR